MHHEHHQKKKINRSLRDVARRTAAREMRAIPRRGLAQRNYARAELALACSTHTHRCAIIAAAAERSHARARVHASEQPPMHACVDYGVLITRIVCTA